MVKPKASSTPKIVDISRRRPIGDVNNDSVQSPILNYTRKSANHTSKSGSSLEKYVNSKSEEELDDIDSTTEIDSSTNEERKTNTIFCNCINPSCFAVITILFSLVAFLYCYTEEQNHVINMSASTLSQEFPSQVEDFWIYIQQGVEDIKEFRKPQTFIFLYKDESQKTLERILEQITLFAMCTLTNCTKLPVVLEASDLSAADVLKDYGEIISRNKEKLEDSGIMIIKNLEKVPGKSAQAFHSFCDELNPIVNKALFIFTMKVESYHNNNLKYVEKYLRDHWKDIRDDKFIALFTRIANVVLPIMLEK